MLSRKRKQALFGGGCNTRALQVTPNNKEAHRVNKPAHVARMTVCFSALLLFVGFVPGCGGMGMVQESPDPVEELQGKWAAYETSTTVPIMKSKNGPGLFCGPLRISSNTMVW